MIQTPEPIYKNLNTYLTAQRMAWLIVFLAYIAQFGGVSCSLDEVKSEERLMTSLQRVQKKLHEIRSIITKYSDSFCRNSLNKTEIALVDLQSCANHQTYVKNEWAKAMNPTLFELRHFRRTLLQVTGARKILNPYFLAKISDFIQDEENIMSDAIRAATEICVLNQEKLPDTPTIMQELQKYESRLTAETTTVTESPTTSVTASTTDAPISASFRIEEWRLLSTGGPTMAEISGPNDTKTITKANETAPINVCRYVNKKCESVYAVDEESYIFSSEAESPDHTAFSETPQTITSNRSEIIRLKSEGDVEHHKGQGKNHARPLHAMMGLKQRVEYPETTLGHMETYEHHGNLSTSYGEMEKRDWNENWSLLGTNCSDYNYGDDCSDAYSDSDCGIGIIENHETHFNETFLPSAKESDGLIQDLSGGDNDQIGGLNCSTASNVSFKLDPVSAGDTDVISDLMNDSNKSTGGLTTNNSTEGLTTNNYTSAVVDDYESANCSDSQGEDDGCRYQSLAPLGMSDPPS